MSKISFKFVPVLLLFVSIGIAFTEQPPSVKSAAADTTTSSVISSGDANFALHESMGLPASVPIFVPEPETHTLTATYYRINSNFESVLMISNQGPNPMPVQVSLFNLSGSQFNLAAVVLAGKEVRAFNLRDYIQSASFQEGSLRVTYQGRRLELGGVVQVIDAGRSLMFDEELSETKYFASTRLEAVWWTKWSDVDLRLAVSNTTSSTITANVSVKGTTPNQTYVTPIVLQSHQTRVLNIDEIVGANVTLLSRIGGMSITHTGQKGDILARGLIFDADRGYSNVIEFSDPGKGKSSNLDGVGLRIGTVNGQPLSHGIVAKNSGTTRVRVKGVLSYTRQSSSGEIVIPDLWINAGEIKEISISALLANNGVTSVLASGLHFEHDGLPGKVLISAQSVSQDGNNIFRVPFRDAKLASSTGTYPWSLEGASKAIVYLQNTGTVAREYKMEISYQGGTYVLGLKTLGTRKISAVDIRKLRDEQIPDENGNRIPQTVNSGKVSWSIHGTGDRSIIGRIEQVNLVTGLSSTSACGRCCPDSFSVATLLPGVVTGFPGDTTPFFLMEQDVDCLGNFLSPFLIPGGGFFGSSDQAVASINSSTGLATAIAPGVATISGDFGGTVFTNCGGETGNDEYCCDQTDVPIHCEASCEIIPNVIDVTPDAGTKKITQILGNPKFIHFVTPKGTGNVTLTATLSSETTEILSDISWEGATESTTDARIATLSRGTASKTVVKIKYKGTAIKELRVWVVWATLTGGVNAPTFTPINSSSGRRVGTTVTAAFTSNAAIQPSSMISDTDRPNLAGAKTTTPPGGTNVSGQPLSGGATMKWDMSRRIKIRATTQTPPFNPTVLVDGNDDFPSNLVIGNDDAGVGDENNNPYTNNAQLASSDEPKRGYTLQGGNVADDYRSQLWFQEFARLEIEGVWQVISDPQPWRVDFKMKKQVVTESLWGMDVNGDGDLNDNVTESDLGLDANGDGDMLDEVGYWNNNSSASANDNAGA